MRLQQLLSSMHRAEHRGAAGSFAGASSRQVLSSHRSWDGARCL